MRNTPEERREAWATYVSALRAAVGVSRSELARRLDVDPATVWRWETKRQKPESPAVPEKLAELFRLDLDEVLMAAGLKPAGEDVPVEPTVEVDPELEQILNSGLPTRLQREMIAEMERRRAEDQARRLADIERTIRLILGPGSKT